jgi:hypothetical protein
MGAILFTGLPRGYGLYLTSARQLPVQVQSDSKHFSSDGACADVLSQL